jgi:hypothetical protein
VKHLIKYTKRIMKRMLIPHINNQSRKRVQLLESY